MAVNYSSLVKRASVLLFIFLSISWGLWIVSPPAPVPGTAPETEFSAERAFRHVVAMAESPHRLGTVENDSVRSYLLNRFKELGLNPEVREGISTSRFRSYRVARTRNIITRMNGTDPGNTIMLMAHYDSVPYSPGAADDAAGVSAILEVVRALKAGGPLKNNLLILITDGEELGLMGARQFSESYENLDEIDLILNVESRGTSGSSIMFETNTGNSKLIPLYNEAANTPVANSLSYTVYRLLPNDTDFSVFKPFGIQGLNHAFIESYLNYHTMQDTPDNLSPASLQHHGENLLDNVRLFGNRSFNLNSDRDVVYFNNPFGSLTYYPQSWVPYLTVIAILLFLFVLYVAFRFRWISTGRTVAGALTFLGILVIGVLISWFGWDFIQFLFPEYRWQQHGETYAREWYLWLFLSASSLLAFFVLRWTSSKINTNNLLAGIYLLWGSLLITITLLLPAVSYFILWPFFFGLIGWLLTGDQIKYRDYGPDALVILCISLFMVLFIFPFYIKQIQITLTGQFLAASILLYLLMAGLLWPLIDYILEGSPRIGYGVLGLVAIACMTGATLNSGFSEDRKKQNSLIYAADLDSGNYHWLSKDHAADEWTSTFLGSQPADTLFNTFEILDDDRLLYANAPADSVKPPDLTVTGDQLTDSLRILSIRVKPGKRIEGIVFSFDPHEQIIESRVEGKVLYNRQQLNDDKPREFSQLTYFTTHDTPFTLDLVLHEDSSSISIQTESYHTDLPAGLMSQYPERPSHQMPKPSGFTNGTLVKKTFNIDWNKQ